MSRHTTKLVLLLCLLFFCDVAAEQDDKVEQLIRAGMDAAYNMRFAEAATLFNQVIKLTPQSPRGHLLQAVNAFYQFQLHETAQTAERFQKHLGLTISRARENLSREQDRLQGWLYLGTANMYRAAYHAEKGDWFKAYLFGRTSIDFLKKAVRADPETYDAYLGLGLYHYYAAVMPALLKTAGALLGIRGDREAGLQQLQIAAQNGRYTQTEATFFLAEIYLEIEKEYDRALVLARDLVARYPENDGFLLFLGRCYRQRGNRKQALQIFVQVRERTARPVFKALASYHAGVTHFDNENYEAAAASLKHARFVAEQTGKTLNWLQEKLRAKLQQCQDIIGEQDQIIEE